MTTKTCTKNDDTTHHASGIAYEGFCEHVRGLAIPHPTTLAMAEAFVADVRPANPASTCAVLLCALDVVRGRRDLLEGHWIVAAGTHVYLYYSGKGYGQLRTLALIERWLRWLHQRDELHAWDLERLLHTADRQRWALTGERRRPGPRPERGVGLEDLEACVNEYLETTQCAPLERQLVHAALNLVAHYACEDGLVRFGALDVTNLAASLYEIASEGEPMEATEWTTLFVTGSRFYKWLGRTGRLRADRAESLSAELGRMGLVSNT